MNTDLNPVVRKSFRGYQLRHIGSGGIGRVYQALGPEGGGKVYKFEIKGAAARERIKDEAKSGFVLAGTPGIVRIDEFGEVDGRLYVGMERVPGITLENLLKQNQGKIPPSQAVDILRQLCEILKNVHDQKYCHADLKPANIMVNQEKGKEKVDVVLIDLGNVVDFSQPVQNYGITPSYSSPEQVEKKNIDQRSDIFTLGIVFLKMLTGKNPFLARNENQTCENIKHKEVPTKLLSNIPMDICLIMLKLLEKSSQQRYQNCQEILGDLNAVQS